MKGLPTDSSSSPSSSKPSTSRRWLYLQLIAVLAILATTVPSLLSSSTQLSAIELEAFGAKCPAQPEPLYPKIKFELEEGYRNTSAHLLSQAVQIASESFDDMGKPTEDPRWAPFFDFQKWLKSAFPLLHSRVKTEYVNTLGIVNTLEGSDPSLKPLLLLSHYDAVPAPASTADRWTHGRFSGFVDDKYVWGRGAADDKSLLVAQYEAMTKLLESPDFDPRRTIILAHGFDEEEVGARQGAGTIAPFLESRYGPNGILLLIDEGTGVVDDVWGAGFAVPASREKGYLDVKISVGTRGGHSSVPPEHTGIGIMSQVIKEIEENPHTPTLTKESPHLGFLACAAEYSPKFPKSYKKLLKDPKKWDKLAGLWAKESLSQKALLSTTQAIDIVNGGVKSNALPELVEMMMNFRIDFSSSIHETQAHLNKALKAIAKKNNMATSLFATSDLQADLGSRYIKAEVFGLPLEPSPNTPEEGELWTMFAGTIKAASPGPKGETRIVAPYSSTGNTDTKVFWNLTKNIYRFMPAPVGSGSGVHTVDEKVSIDAHLGVIKWLHAIMQNANDYDGAQ